MNIFSTQQPDFSSIKNLENVMQRKNEKEENYKEDMREYSQETVDTLKDLTDTIKESNKSNNKLSKRMLWLTIATAFLALVQVAIGIIQIYNK
jgi:Flp pilus assembly protein TadB